MSRLIPLTSLCFAILVLFACKNTISTPEKFVERSVKIIPLATPLDQKQAEISGMDWCEGGNTLWLLPQYPDFATGSSGEGQLFAIDKALLQRVVTGSADTAIESRPIGINTQGIENVIAGYEGFEAIACRDNDVWLSVEAASDRGAYSVLVQGQYNPVSDTLTLAPDSMVTLDPQTILPNAAGESLVGTKDGVVVLHEINAPVNGKKPAAFHIDRGNAIRLPMPEIPFRLTDATRSDNRGRFWAMNYFYEGDQHLAREVDPLMPDQTPGISHQLMPSVERLVEFELRDNRIVRTARAPVYLRLDPRAGRNWEAIARLDDLGFLLASDEHPETLLGFVPYPARPDFVRIATFNASIEANNLKPKGATASTDIVKQAIASADHPQLRNIAETIQRVRPDVLLINEFDLIQPANTGIKPFIENYLQVSQNGLAPLDFPYYFTDAVNTGVASGFDLNRDSKISAAGNDAWGYGEFPGHYGMVLLSRYPIETQKIRTLRKFLWKDMPNHQTTLNPADGTPWYSSEAWQQFPLSSKSHWDVPVRVAGHSIHVLAAHPTPPVFDGDEDRNGKRNYDEIRLLADYISGAAYLYSDDGIRGGLGADASFIVLGDMNASPDEGDSVDGAIDQLLNHPLVDSTCQPQSAGGLQARPDNPHAAGHTAAWGMRVDYVLPSNNLDTVDCGVFWPSQAHPNARLTENRKLSSDHRLVWLDIMLPEQSGQ